MKQNSRDIFWLVVVGVTAVTSEVPFRRQNKDFHIAKATRNVEAKVQMASMFPSVNGSPTRRGEPKVE